MQQYNAAPQPADVYGQQPWPLNGGVPTFDPMGIAPAQGYGYPAAANTVPFDGTSDFGGFGQQQLALNGDNAQQLGTTFDAAAQGNGYPASANNAPLNGGMAQYGMPAANTAAPADVNWMGQQQPARNVNPPSLRGQYAAAPQRAAPIDAAVARRQNATNGVRKQRQNGSADAGRARRATLAQQLGAAQEGPYARTAAGVPNRDPTRPGNRQGQTKGWGQALKHHGSRCNRFVLDGCVPDCELHARFPETWADWDMRRFRVQWQIVQPGRPQTEVLSGMAVAARKEHAEGFVVLGEVRADGTLDKSSKKVVRVDAAPL